MRVLPSGPVFAAAPCSLLSCRLVKLGRFTAGYVISTGIAAVVFILALKFAGTRFPKVPVVGSVARAI